MMNKIGLLGGTFNPIHKGHIDLGLKVMNTFNFDKVLYILSAKPPHKKQSNIVSAEIRWEMLNRALSPFPDLIPCDIELNRSDYSWTHETIKMLKVHYPNNTFYFISGSEGFLKIRTWKNYRYLLESLPFIVVFRERSDKNRVEALLKAENITPCLNVTEWKKLPCIYFFSYRSDKLLISSTLIREKVKMSQPIDKFVEKEVQKIMEEYKLYEC